MRWWFAPGRLRRSCSWQAWISTSDAFEAGQWNDALGGWLLSLGLWMLLAVVLWLLGIVQAPVIVAFALSTTALGTIIPSLQDSRSLNTRLLTYVLQVRSVI